MQGNRLLRIVAVLVLIVAVVYLVLALGSALMLRGRGFGAGWGTGWNGWLVLPIVGSAIAATVTLVVFGLMLYMLTRIDDNLAAARQQKRGQPKAVVAPAVTAMPAGQLAIDAAPAAVAAAVGTVVATSRDAEAFPAEPVSVVEPELPSETTAAATEEHVIEAVPAEAAAELGTEIPTVPVVAEEIVSIGEPALEVTPVEAELEPVVTTGGVPATVEFETEIPSVEAAAEVELAAGEVGLEEPTVGLSEPAEITASAAMVAAGVAAVANEAADRKAAEVETPDEVELPRVELVEVEAEVPEVTAAEAALLAAGVHEAAERASEQPLVEVIPLETEFVEPEVRLIEIAIPEELPQVAAPEVELPRVDLEISESQFESADMTPRVDLQAVLPEVGLPAADMVGLGEEAAAAVVAEAETRLPQVEITEPAGAHVETVAALSEETGVPEPELSSDVPAVPVDERIVASLPRDEAASAATELVEATGLQAELAALRAQLAALQAQVAGLSAADVAAAGAAVTIGAARSATVELADEAAAESVAVDLPSAGGRLPGSDEVARIAAEMAAVKRMSQPVSVETEALSKSLQAAGLRAQGDDDLESITGIGPIYAKRLRELNITTYEQLAAASYEQLGQVTRGKLARVIKEDWCGQAQRLINEK